MSVVLTVLMFLHLRNRSLGAEVHPSPGTDFYPYLRLDTGGEKVQGRVPNPEGRRGCRRGDSSRGQGHAFCARRPRLVSPTIHPTLRGRTTRSAPAGPKGFKSNADRGFSSRMRDYSCRSLGRARQSQPRCPAKDVGHDPPLGEGPQVQICSSPNSDASSTSPQQRLGRPAFRWERNPARHSRCRFVADARSSAPDLPASPATGRAIPPCEEWQTTR